MGTIGRLILMIDHKDVNQERMSEQSMHTKGLSYQLTREYGRTNMT